MRFLFAILPCVLISMCVLLFLNSCSGNQVESVAQQDEARKGIQANGIQVIDSPVKRVTHYRIIHFRSEGVDGQQLAQMMDVSGFRLTVIERGHAGHVFLEALQRGITEEQWRDGLSAINALSFVDDARFEQIVRPLSQE